MLRGTLRAWTTGPSWAGRLGHRLTFPGKPQGPSRASHGGEGSALALPPFSASFIQRLGLGRQPEGPERKLQESLKQRDKEKEEGR